jgi:hypothetical protein
LYNNNPVITILPIIDSTRLAYSKMFPKKSQICPYSDFTINLPIFLQSSEGLSFKKIFPRIEHHLVLDAKFQTEKTKKLLKRIEKGEKKFELISQNLNLSEVKRLNYNDLFKFTSNISETNVD